MLPPQPPQPPSPPQVLPEKVQEGRRGNGEDPFNELGLSQEQFAEIALNSPFDWDSEQMDFLQSLLEGDPMEPEVTRGLVEDFIHYIPKPMKAPKERREELTVPEDMMDPEELAEVLAESVPVHMRYQPVEALNVPSSNINLDDWLSKK